jgi:hypothetical protein
MNLNLNSHIDALAEREKHNRKQNILLAKAQQSLAANEDKIKKLIEFTELPITSIAVSNVWPYRDQIVSGISFLEIRAYCALDEETFFAMSPWMEWQSINVLWNIPEYQGLIRIADGEIMLSINISAKVAEEDVKTLENMEKIIYESPATPEPEMRVNCQV